MKGKILPVPLLHFVLVLVLQYEGSSANICASSPTMIQGLTSGKFSSPNYPNNYPHNTNQTWKIVAPVGQVIHLYFASFSLERSNSCQHDYLKIRNRCDDAVPMAVYCDHTARPLRSSSNVLWVEFRSDATINYKGFEAIYKMNTNADKLVSCPRLSDNQAKIDYCLVGTLVQCCNKYDSNCRVNTILTANSGTITSPGYPGYYPHGTLIFWRITVPEGYVVQLNFTTLITENSLSCSNSASKCNCDYVQAVDGPCRYNVGPRWCGGWTSQNIYPSFITTGRHMVVAFRSDLSNNHVGFVAHYRRALNCSGDKPISCLDNGNPSCCSRDAAVCVSGTSTRSHCPRTGDPSTYTGCCTMQGSPSCCPVLQSGQNINCPRSSDNQAFIDVCLSRGRQVCCNKNLPVCRYNKLLTEPSGTITSPGYPSSYPHNMVVVWRITVPEGFLVQLNFTKLKIERGAACSGCNCDYVGYRDGPCFNSHGTKWCGKVADYESRKLPSFISTGRHVQVFFKSDASLNEEGFVVKYRRALKCSGDKPYSCLNNGQPACCKISGASRVSAISTKLWIVMIITMTAVLLLK